MAWMMLAVGVIVPDSQISFLDRVTRVERKWVSSAKRRRLAQTGDSEGGRFVGSSQEHRTAVGLGIVDAIRNADPLGGGTEVMIVDIRGGLLPFHSRVLEVTD